jgi:hypothetical protein
MKREMAARILPMADLTLVVKQLQRNATVSPPKWRPSTKKAIGHESPIGPWLPFETQAACSSFQGTQADRMKNLGNNAAALRRAARRSKPAWEEIVGAECREQFRPLADAEVFSLDIPFNRTADHPIISNRCIPMRGGPLSTSLWGSGCAMARNNPASGAARLAR